MTMREDSTAEECYVLIDDSARFERRARRRRRFEIHEEDVVDPWSYAAKRGRGTLRLSLVEYRILRVLAARPNQAITERRIADAVSTPRQRISTDSLHCYIHSLRGQLGFYSDYIQS